MQIKRENGIPLYQLSNRPSSIAQTGIHMKKKGMLLDIGYSLTNLFTRHVFLRDTGVFFFDKHPWTFWRFESILFLFQKVNEVTLQVRDGTNERLVSPSFSPSPRLFDGGYRVGALSVLGRMRRASGTAANFNIWGNSADRSSAKFAGKRRKCPWWFNEPFKALSKRTLLTAKQTIRNNRLNSDAARAR